MTKIYNLHMDTREKILSYIKKKGEVSGKELVEVLGITRQAVNKHIKKLVQEGLLIKEGCTKGTVYKVASSHKKFSALAKFEKIYSLEGLEEHEVFREVDLFLGLRKGLKENVYQIINYAFTEMLNNAIEHSESAKCKVEVVLTPYYCGFEIRDYGIGIFYSIFKKFNLQDEVSAVGELIKGKVTTLPGGHTGEGVFFTSKAGDKVSFRSHKINLIFDNQKKDVYVEEKRYIKGTKVNFVISRGSKRLLNKIFEEYAPEDFEYKFERTRVYVKLFQREYLSRSEARRLLSGLDKFREVILDFKDVRSIGQGFADEIFRVFKNTHPEVRIKLQNLAPAVEAVIKHVVDKKE